jgi:NAD(P)H-flavin reductase
MIADAVRAGQTAPLWLLFGVRTEADAVYRDEFDALARAHPFVRVELTLSRAGDGWSGRRGYVQEHVAGLWKELARDHTPHAYICGVLKMITDVRGILKDELHVPREQIHAESYG